MIVKRPIAVVGDVAYVPLTQGERAIIDAKDVPLVEGRNWAVLKRRKRLCYAVSAGKPPGPKTLYMHRLILGPPDGMETDHINHDGLDNRRANLRACTGSQNQLNKRMSDNPEPCPSFHVDPCTARVLRLLAGDDGDTVGSLVRVWATAEVEKRRAENRWPPDVGTKT